MLSASKAGLLRHCQYWAREDVEQDPSTDSEAAQRGTRVHAAIESMVRGMRAGNMVYLAVSDSSSDEELMIVHAFNWLKTKVAGRLRAEVPYAWDPDTNEAQEIRLTGQRAYADPATWAAYRDRHGLGPRTVPMTVDLIEDEGHTITTYDWCTGRTAKLAQLQLNAIAVWLSQQDQAFGVDCIRMLTLRLTPEGLTEEDHGSLTSVDIERLSLEYGLLIQQNKHSEPSPGMHCREMYCPARGNCPTTRQAMEQAIPASSLTRFRFTDQIESVEHASALLPMYKLAEDYVERVKKSLQAYSREHGPIPTSQGKEWGEGIRNDSRFNKDLALALLKQLGATEAQIAGLNKTQTIPVFSERKARS